MGIKLYIESMDKESWRDLSRDFGEYIVKNQNPKKFGIVEADSIKNNQLSITLFGFFLNQEYHDSVKYFKDWAKS
jgi:hypothetical protein